MNRRQLLSTAAAAAVAPTSLLASGATDVLSQSDLQANGFSFTDLARQLDGERITVTGFMTPPVRGAADLAVLVDRPTRICPVCTERAGEQAMSLCGPCSSGNGPSLAKAMAIHAKQAIRKVPYNVRVDVTGTLEIGNEFEERTGFLSASRLLDADLSVARLTSF